MKNLRMFVAIFFILNLTIVSLAEAQRRPPPGPRPVPSPRPVPPRPIPGPGPGYPAPGVIVCVATDDGWEEHWGGHRSCGECVQRHGDCTETCSERSTVCEMEGMTYNGGRIRFRAVGRDRYDAEREARRQCEWNRDVRSCSPCRFSDQNRPISRRRCR